MVVSGHHQSRRVHRRLRLSLRLIAAVLDAAGRQLLVLLDLTWPFAIAVGIILLAGLGLRPAPLSNAALAAGHPAHPLFGKCSRPRQADPVEHPGLGQDRSVGPGCLGQIVQHAVPTLILGLVLFGGLAFGVIGYASSRQFGGDRGRRGSGGAARRAARRRWPGTPMIRRLIHRPDLQVRHAGVHTKPGAAIRRPAKAAGRQPVRQPSAAH